MGAETAIGWCDCTFNPWWGCVEVSPECDRCYARTWATFTRHNVWGKDAPRRFFGDTHWDEPFLALPCAGPRWVSAEPLLDRVDLRPYLAGFGQPSGARRAVSWVSREGSQDQGTGR